MSRKTTLILSILSLLIFATPLIAQRTPKPMPAKPDHKAVRAAFEKAIKLDEFNAASMKGDVKLTKSMLVDNGAPRDIVLVLTFPTTVSSDPLPSDIPNQPCDSGWVLVVTWTPYPPPNGKYYSFWTCRTKNMGSGMIQWWL